MADLIASHVTQLTTLLSEPACRLAKPIEIDYSFIEVEDQYLFDIAGKRFIKESGSLKGSPQALIRYEYSESKKPNPVPFIEGKYFHFAVFLDPNKLISNLKEGPKGFCLQLSIYCHDQNFLSHFTTPDTTSSHNLSFLITPFPLRWKQNHLMLATLKLVASPLTSYHILSCLVTPYHTLSQLIP